MPTPNPLAAYQKFQDAFSADVKSVANQVSLGQIYTACCRFLGGIKTVTLTSLISNKEYFAFSQGAKISRAVNKSLFLLEPGQWETFCNSLAARKAPSLDPQQITRIIYSVAVSFFSF